MSAMLGELGRSKEALDSMKEASEKLWPFFERLPMAFKMPIEHIHASLRELHQALALPLTPELEQQMAAFERLTKS